MATRQPAVAGIFYPGEKQALLKQLEALFKGIPKQEKVRIVVAPHAGYEYSGRTAAYSYKALQENKTFVILGPSHTGLGPEISVSDASEWETPLGKVEVELKQTTLPTSKNTVLRYRFLFFSTNSKILRFCQ